MFKSVDEGTISLKRDVTALYFNIACVLIPFVKSQSASFLCTTYVHRVSNKETRWSSNLESDQPKILRCNLLRLKTIFH